MNFVTDQKRYELLTSASADLADAQYSDSWLPDLLQSELKMKLLEVENGHVPQCPIAGDATACKRVFRRLCIVCSCKCHTVLR